MEPLTERDLSLIAWQRRVHSLQLERGISSIVVAGGDQASAYAASLRAIRKKVDEAIVDAPTTIHRLDLERRAIDVALASSVATPCDAGRIFYTVFLSFSTMIKQVLNASMHGDGASDVESKFALLKEDMARERGFVGAVLALPEEGVASLPSRAFADHVVCLHSQRAHVAALREEASVEEAALIATGVTPTAELQDVQERLLRTFDVVGVRSGQSITR